MLGKKIIYMIFIAGFIFYTAGCGDLLEVEDPQSYADEDLNREEALAAVANGVLGNFYNSLDSFILATALLSDEYQHTGTWNDWDLISNGDIRPGIPNNENDTSLDNFLRTRWAAQDAIERIEEVFGENASANEYYVQVLTVKAFCNLIISMGYAEAPAEPSKMAVTDQELVSIAIDELSSVINLAESNGFESWRLLAIAGRARANLIAGNYSTALTDAQQIPQGFVHNAIYSLNTNNQENRIVSTTHRDFNRAGGLYHGWWDQIDTQGGYLIDPYSGELDIRVPIAHQDGDLGVDGITPHYSEMKYTQLGDDIRLTHWQEMRLIEAEVYYRQGDFDDALNKINEIRSNAGLPEHSMPATTSTIEDFILYERFSEMFLEGHRLNDLNRFDRISEILGTGRVVKLPISVNEVNANSNISFPRELPNISN